MAIFNTALMGCFVSFSATKSVCVFHKMPNSSFSVTLCFSAFFMKATLDFNPPGCLQLVSAASCRHVSLLLCWRVFYLHIAITVGEDVKQAYLQEVLKRERKKYMVSVFSISDQTESDHQCSTETTYPNKSDGKAGSCWESFSWEGTFRKDTSLPWCIRRSRQRDRHCVSVTHSLHLW